MTDQDVVNLIEEFHMPLHVRRHCVTVANFAMELAQKISRNGIKIDMDLLRHSALLHDLVRVVDFRELKPETWKDPSTEEDKKIWLELRKKYAGLHHAEAGARILEERGFAKEAQLVRSHRFLQIEKGLTTWEEKLLYYADKRTKHDAVVSLKERLLDGRKRNEPETLESEHAKKLDEKVFALEREILLAACSV